MEGKRIYPEKVLQQQKIGLHLSFLDLAQLVVGPLSNAGQNWEPGDALQFSTFNCRRNLMLETLIRDLITSGRYRSREERGNTILIPNCQPSQDLVKLVAEVKDLSSWPTFPLRLLGTLSFFNEVSEVTILPNSSLGKRGKINGVVIQLEEKPSDRLLARLSWDFGRHIGIFSLRGLDVEGFIWNFCEGEELKHPDAKICDFYFDENGTVYLLAVARGQPINDYKIFQGPIWQVAARMREREQMEKDKLFQVALEITRQIRQIRQIGNKVTTEEITTHPYIYYNPETNQLVSGGSDDNLTIVNSGRTMPLILAEDKGLTPVGNPPESLISRIVGWEGPTAVQLSLTPVRNFGL